MIKTRHLLVIIIPAIFIVFIAFGIRLLQFEAMQKTNEEIKQVATQTNFTIPILPEDPILGNKKAPNTIITFEDFACPACQIQNALMDDLLIKYPDKIKIIWKGLSVVDFPISGKDAHHYAYCANAQNKFTEFKELAFANSDNLTLETLQSITTSTILNDHKLADCLASTAPATYLQTTEQIAKALNIQSVPTIFLNGKQIANPQILEEWENVLELK